MTRASRAPQSLMDLRIPFDDGWGYTPSHTGKLQDYSGVVQPDRVAVLFRDLEDHLCDLVRESDLVVGCVAWLTSERVLAALADVKDGVSVVVQKEDFLRPDHGHDRAVWRSRLRHLYDSLTPGPIRYSHGQLVATLSFAGDPEIAPVRCVGNHNRDRSPAFPRMHNKFLVFCDYKPCCKNDELSELLPEDRITPRAVWTGSFNLTQNATRSFENAVVLTGVDVATRYYNEWQQILALSEPLDWRSEWAEPEWRIGT